MNIFKLPEPFLVGAALVAAQDLPCPQGLPLPGVGSFAKKMA
jgi:hypothetical protein